MRPPVDAKEALVYERFYQRTSEALRSLLTDDLIAEHERQPLGQHTDHLERVLRFFRSGEARDKYVIICTLPHREWRIGRLSGVRGEAPRLVGDERFASIEDAFHGVFLRRIGELRSGNEGPHDGSNKAQTRSKTE